jgi:hypothetical protein
MDAAGGDEGSRTINLEYQEESEMPAAQSYLMSGRYAHGQIRKKSDVCVFASGEADYEQLRELHVSTLCVSSPSACVHGLRTPHVFAVCTFVWLQ